MQEYDKSSSVTELTTKILTKNIGSYAKLFGLHVMTTIVYVAIWYFIFKNPLGTALDFLPQENSQGLHGSLGGGYGQEQTLSSVIYWLLLGLLCFCLTYVMQAAFAGAYVYYSAKKTIGHQCDVKEAFLYGWQSCGWHLLAMIFLFFIYQMTFSLPTTVVATIAELYGVSPVLTVALILLAALPGLYVISRLWLLSDVSVLLQSVPIQAVWQKTGEHFKDICLWSGVLILQCLLFMVIPILMIYGTMVSGAEDGIEDISNTSILFTAILFTLTILGIFFWSVVFRVVMLFKIGVLDEFYVMQTYGKMSQQHVAFKRREIAAKYGLNPTPTPNELSRNSSDKSPFYSE